MAKWTWSAAVRSGDLLNLGAFTESVREAGADGVHVDIGDSRYYRGFGVGTDVAAALATASAADVHLQAERADTLVPRLLELGCRSVTIHVECLTHTHRALTSIREAGMEAGLAIGPGTPLTALEYLLPFVDRVLLVTREPNGGADPLPATAFERVKIVRDNVDYHKHKAAVEVEGALGARDVAQLIAHGADRVVVDDPALFASGDLTAALLDFVEEVRAQQHVA